MAGKSEFQVRILKENQVIYDGLCRVLFVPDTTGKEELAILPFHTPLIGLVGAGMVRIGTGGKAKPVTEIKRGIVHCSNNEATVLVNA